MSNPILTIVRLFNGHVDVDGETISCKKGRDVHVFNVVNRIISYVVRGDSDESKQLAWDLGADISPNLFLKDPKYSWFGIIKVEGDAGRVALFYHSEDESLADSIADAIAYELHMAVDGSSTIKNTEPPYERFKSYVHTWSMEEAYIKDGGEGEEE